MRRRELPLLHRPEDLPLARHGVYDEVWATIHWGRPLKKRLDEHPRALIRPQANLNDSFSRYRTNVHTRDSTPEFDVMVLHRHLENTLYRKSMEAREIKQHQPEINNKEELVEALKLIA
ncbi:hypothetical protein Y032_0027g1634 [Ancylostoma ceylanicum]|uniref:Uncharacterized protein n=1 Tax=Ancylostoma ceylanicum TaxID=53326 RepID=A0A016UW21_9BILA|nr:hypothetical protein Y032_0027g1634 [Ancylostoma ceylanicum]